MLEISKTEMITIMPMATFGSRFLCARYSTTTNQITSPAPIREL